MNRIKQLRRIAAVLAGLACAWLGAAVVSPAAFAMIPGPNHETAVIQPPVVPAVTHTLVVGGMPGWQITLIAAGAALLAAAVAVLLDRARAARRPTALTAAH
jgi:hypothetical protein